MNRAGATDTTTEPSTSQAKGVMLEAPLVRAGAPAKGDDETGTGVATTASGARMAAAKESPAVDPPSTAGDGPTLPQKGASNPNPKPTKMGTNLYDVSWSLEEQSVLEKGLQTYTESAYAGLWRYVKIAAHLPAKGVRDVALRVRWMKRKHAGEKTSAKRRKANNSTTILANGANDAGAVAGSIPGGGERDGSGAEKKTKKSQGANRGANRGASQGASQGANGAGRPRSVFSMPMPGSGAAPARGAADCLPIGGSVTISGVRGGGGHILGGRVQGGPPGYGAMGGGMGTGVLPVPGVPGYAHPGIPGMPPGMYPHAYPLAGMPPGMPPPGAAPPPPHPSANVLRVPPPAAPPGALEDHGGVEITAGVGAIDRRMYGRLVSNGAIIARLRDDDAARDGSLLIADESSGDAKGSKRDTSLLSPKERMALLTEFRDALLDILETMRVTGGIMQRMPPLPVAVDGALASALLPPPKTAVLDASYGQTVAPGSARAPSAMTFVPMANGGGPEARPSTGARTNGARKRSETTESSPARRARGASKPDAPAKKKNKAEAKRRGAASETGAGASASPRATAGGRGNKGGRRGKK